LSEIEQDYCFDDITCGIATKANNYCNPSNRCDRYFTYNTADASGAWEETSNKYFQSNKIDGYFSIIILILTSNYFINFYLIIIK